MAIEMRLSRALDSILQVVPFRKECKATRRLDSEKWERIPQSCKNGLS